MVSLVKPIKTLLSNIEGDIQSPISILGKNISSVDEGYGDFVDEE